MLTMPICGFGYTAVEVVDYYNWLHPEEKQYTFELFDVAPFEDKTALVNSLKLFGASSVPIGSVEFALAWFKAMGVDNVKPLNIPRELWRFCDRRVTTGFLCDFNGSYMIKDIDKVKADGNGFVHLCCDERRDKEWFITEWLPDVMSEWRVFVFDGKVCDIRCYSGDFWKTPDREYIERVVKEYNNPSYTLDVMVTPNRTEILELHDFFSCGLYGFDDYSVLPLMWKRAIRNVMEREKVNK